MQIERERAVKWAKMTTQWKKYSDSDKLMRRVNKGIPNSVRGTVWRHVMGIERVKEEGVYQVGYGVWEYGSMGMEYGVWEYGVWGIWYGVQNMGVWGVYYCVWYYNV